MGHFLRYLNIFLRVSVLLTLIIVPIYVLKNFPHPDMHGHTQAVEYLYDVRLAVTSISAVSPNITALTLTYQPTMEVRHGSKSSGALDTFNFDIPLYSDGYFQSIGELGTIGFKLHDQNGMLVSDVNMTSQIAPLLPTMWSLKAGGDTSTQLTLSNGMHVNYNILILPVYGLSGHSMLEIVMIAILVKVGVCMLIAGLDMCMCQSEPFYEKSEAWAVWSGNAVWLLLGGLFIAKLYFLLALAWILSIIGCPIGVELLEVSRLSLAPFGRQVRKERNESEFKECCGCALNTIWILLGGWVLALLHLVIGIVLCLLIVTIPLGLQHFKLMKIIITPFNLTVDYLREEESKGGDVLLGGKTNGQGFVYGY